MTVTELNWSATEKDVAQQAFKKAYEREINALLAEVREQAVRISNVEDLWCLHDFLSSRRHAIDGKYDYCYSGLLFVFAGLLKEGWLNLQELDGLEKDKLAKVSALARM